MRSTKKPGAIDEDAYQARDLLLWLRSERIAVASITVGEVTLHGLLDRKLDPIDHERKPGEDARQGIIEQYGGPLFTPTEATTEGGIEPTVEDDDT
jgi:hypothetical protein